MISPVRAGETGTTRKLVSVGNNVGNDHINGSRHRRIQEDMRGSIRAAIKAGSFCKTATTAKNVNTPTNVKKGVRRSNAIFK